MTYSLWLLCALKYSRPSKYKKLTWPSFCCQIQQFWSPSMFANNQPFSVAADVCNTRLGSAPGFATELEHRSLLFSPLLFIHFCLLCFFFFCLVFLRIPLLELTRKKFQSRYAQVEDFSLVFPLFLHRNVFSTCPAFYIWIPVLQEFSNAASNPENSVLLTK